MENRAWHEATERFFTLYLTSLSRKRSLRTLLSQNHQLSNLWISAVFLSPNFSCRSHRGSQHTFAHEKSGLGGRSKAAEGCRTPRRVAFSRAQRESAGLGVRQPLCSSHGFGVDDQAAAPVLSPQPTPTACGRARLTSQVQLLAPRLKGQLIDDPEPGPFR
jgi:hypothetical protein